MRELVVGQPISFNHMRVSKYPPLAASRQTFSSHGHPCSLRKGCETSAATAYIPLAPMEEHRRQHILHLHEDISELLEAILINLAEEWLSRTCIPSG